MRTLDFRAGVGGVGGGNAKAESLGYLKAVKEHCKPLLLLEWQNPLVPNKLVGETNAVDKQVADVWAKYHDPFPGNLAKHIRRNASSVSLLTCPSCTNLYVFLSCQIKK